MKVLITGGAGFIGSHLADRLRARGDSILILDNYATARRDNIAPGPGVEIVEGSVADATLVESIFRLFKPEVAVHAAASYKDPDNWEEDARTNVQGSAIIAQATKRHGARRLIYFQTALCYGLHPQEQPITLSHPLRPYESSYAISKTAGENYIALAGIDFISFRLANAYGPRNLSGPLPTFYHRLANGKKCFVMDTRRDFVYIQDLLDVVVKAIDGMGSRGYYHISSGRDYAIKELFDAVVKALEIKLTGPVEIRNRGVDDAYTILLDPTKTNIDFQWQVSTPLSQGVAAAIAYYKEKGVTQTFTHLKPPAGEKA